MGLVSRVCSRLQLEDVYEVYLPSQVRSLLQQVRIVISIGIEGVPLACVGADGYVKRLQFWMLAPVALVSLAVLVVLVQLLYQRRSCSREVLLSRAAPAVLRGFFLLCIQRRDPNHRRHWHSSATLP
jgi:hypothetical protein